MLTNIKKKIFKYAGLLKKEEPINLRNSIVGTNTDIRGNISQERAPNSRLIIGKDSLICCDIFFETNDAVLIIGDSVFIGPRTSIVCTKEITIESNVLISSDCMIQDSDNHSLDFEIRKNDIADWKKGFHDWAKHPSIPIKISHGAWIGAKAIILKGVTIGEKSVVGAGSVVTKSVNDNTIVGGNPAKIIRTFNMDNEG